MKSGESNNPSEVIEEVLREIYKNQQGFQVQTSVHLKKIE